LQPRYEEHHHCKYTEDAIQSAVTLSDRYIVGRFLPDKAIDLMDEAGAKARIASMHQPHNLMKFESEIEEVRLAKEDAITEQDYEKAAKLRDSEKKLREELESLTKAWSSTKEENKVVVDEEEIAAIISKQTGIPLTRLTEAETTKVLKMEEVLKDTVIGQDEAVTSVCSAIRRSRAGIKDPNRPIGAFLFLGPTGVGKTLFAKQLAIQMFGGEDALIQVDMSEYMEKFAVSRMTGSPPGYVGYEEGGQLSEQVRQRPYCVILFDEIEKAHPDVMNLLLQICEEGRLTDSFGRKIDFRNTIVIMTSNVGSDLIRGQTEMGFGAQETIYDPKKLEEVAGGAAKKFFRPELINRLDGMIIFHMLSKASLMKIVDLEFKKVQERVAPKQILLSLDQKAKEFLVAKGYEPKMGARPIRRAIEVYLENPLANMLLMNPAKGASYLATVEGDKIVFVEQEAPPLDAKEPAASLKTK
jgi:ATP-dependent Clp protease ATP-binding subunit ClpC